MLKSNNSGDQSGKLKEFSLFRLSFSQNSFELEKGKLKDGSVNFTSLAEKKLTFAFEPSILRFPEYINSLTELLRNTFGDLLKSENRVAIILPKEWGFTFDIPHPGALPEEDLKRHILWSAKNITWEDAEQLHLNYRKIEKNKIRISAVRHGIIDFAYKLAHNLSFKLLQLSLENTTYLNLIAEDALSIMEGEDSVAEISETTPKESLKQETKPVAQIEPEVIEKTPPTVISPNDPEPEEKEIKADAKEEKSPPTREKPVRKAPRRKFPVRSLVWILIILVVGASGYWGYNNYGDYALNYVNTLWTKIISQIKQVSSDSQSSESTPVDSDVIVESPDIVEAAPVQIEPLYSTLPEVLQRNGDLLFLSMTGDMVRTEILLSRKSEIERVIAQLDSLALINSAECPYFNQIGSSYSAIFTCRVNEDILNTYRHPPAEEIFDLIKGKGFKVVRGVYNGTIEGIEQILQILDENKILLYRIVVAKENQSRYSLSLEH